MKLVFRSSSINTSYTVNYVTQNVSIGGTVKKGVKSVYNLTILPRYGYVLNAKDFSHGLLPKEISQVVFSNTGSKIDFQNKVNVSVYLSNDFTISGVENIVFDIPISGSGRFPSSRVDLTVRCPENDNLLTITKPNPNAVESNVTLDVNKVKSITYTVNGKPGVKILLVQKEFSAFENSHFLSPPKHVLNARSRSRYKVEMNNKYDSQRRLVSKVFSIYYTFPQENFISNDSIDFAVVPTPSFVKQSDPKYFESQEPRIYSFNTPTSVGQLGGVQPVIIKGVPGTPFRVAISNTSGQIYDVDKGAFASGGQFLQGIIPPAVGGQPFGVFRQNIRVPSIFENNTDATANNFTSSTTTGNKVQMRLLTEENVKTNISSLHDKRDSNLIDRTESGRIENTSTFQAQNTSIFLFPNFVYQSSGHFSQTATVRKLTISDRKLIEETTLSGTSQDNSSINIQGVHGTRSPYSWNFEYVISTTGGTYNSIRIIRQPKFLMWDGEENSDSKFRRWDCQDGTITCADANEKLIQGLDGDLYDESTIFNDWFVGEDGSTLDGNQISATFGAKFRIGAKVEGVGDEVLSTGDTSGDTDNYTYYKKVRIIGSINGISFPSRKIDLALRLQNFLSLKNI